MGCWAKAAAKHLRDRPQNQCDVWRGAHTALVWYHSTHGHATQARTLLHPPALPGNRVRDSKISAKTGPFFNAYSCPFRGAASPHRWLAKLSKAPHSQISLGSPCPKPGQGSGEPLLQASKHLRHITNAPEQRGGTRVGRKEKHKKPWGQKAKHQHRETRRSGEDWLLPPRNSFKKTLQLIYADPLWVLLAPHQPIWHPPQQRAIGFQCNVSGKSNCFSKHFLSREVL